MVEEKEKKVLTPEEKSAKKQRRRKIFLRVLCGILAVIVLFVGVTSCISVVSFRSNLRKTQLFSSVGSAELALENTASGCWTIYTDKELKIMQLTDIHFGGGWMSMKKDSMALNAVAAMISAEKPDLVIVTGDVAYPILMQAGTINNKSGAKLFASLMESLGVYWTMTFGNHDIELHSRYSREDIVDFYSSGDYPHCLMQRGPENVDGCGNQVIKIVNSDGVITRALILMDSNAYTDDYIPLLRANYDNLHPNQIQWYRDTVSELNEQNEKKFSTMNAEKATKYAAEFPVVPTSVYLHIPMTEYRDAWNEYVANGYADTENVQFRYGVQGEAVCCPANEDDMFETMHELGSTDTVFCGHDHVNTYSVTYKGIDLTYGMSVDYLAYIGIYKQGAQRGCTIIHYQPDGSVEYHPENYYQDKYISYYEKETVNME